MLSFLHFLPKLRDIAYWVAELNIVNVLYHIGNIYLLFLSSNNKTVNSIPPSIPHIDTEFTTSEWPIRNLSVSIIKYNWTD